MLRREGWEAVEKWLRELAAAPAGAWEHLTVIDRTNREAEVSLGRYDRNPGHDPYIPADEHLVQWVTDVTEGNGIGQARTSIRVRAWLGKGSAPAGARQFVLYDDTAPDTSPQPQTPQQVESAATAVGLRSLGDHTATFASTVTRTFDNLMISVNKMLTALSGDVIEARARAAREHEARYRETREVTEAEALVRIQEGETRVREAAIEKIGGTLEGLGKAVAQQILGPSVDPEVAALLASVRGTPLEAALKDPKVAELLRVKEAQAGLAEILRELANPKPDNGAATEPSPPDPSAAFEPAATEAS